MRRLLIPVLLVVAACNQAPNPADIACEAAKLDVSLALSGWPKLYGGAANRSVATGPGPTIGNDAFTTALPGAPTGVVLGESAGRAYFPLGAGGLAAFDGQAQAWVRPGSFSAAPVVGAGGTVFAVDDAGTVQALEPGAGVPQWTQTVPTPVGAGLTIAPNGQLAVPAGGELHVFTTGGAFQWSYPATGGVVGVPAIGLDGNFIVADNAGSITALSEIGAERWGFDGAATLLAPPVVDAACNTYLVTNDAITSVEPLGFIRWSVTLPGAPSGVPVLSANESVYLIADGELLRITTVGTILPRGTVGNAGMVLSDAAGRILIVDSAGTVAAIDEPGVQRWTYDAGAAISAAAVTGDGGLLLATQDAQLIRVE